MPIRAGARSAGGKRRWRVALFSPRVILVRLFIAALVVAIVAVASVPLFVLLDLLGGGDGLGLCPRGVSACESSYFDGPELAFRLTLLMFGLLAVLRIFILLHRRLSERRNTVSTV